MNTTPLQPAASERGQGLQRTTMLTSVANAAIDARKACNGIKRAASLAVASMLAGLDGEQGLATAERMATDVLKSIGFDDSRAESVMPMMLEATCLVLADAARHASGGLSGVALEKAADHGVATLVAVAKSRAVAKMVEPAYPADIDAVVALRLSAAAAMSQVAVEVADWDFIHSPSECIKEAGKVVVKAAMGAAEQLAPAQTPAAARVQLAQSLIQSAAKVYAATWKAVGLDEAARLDAMSDAAREAALDQMGQTALTRLLAPVNERFQAAFAGIIQCAKDVFAGPERQPARRPARPR